MAIKRTRNQLISTFLVAFISNAISIYPNSTYAKDETNLDQLLEGFEDDKPAPPPTKLDDLMEGFEDSAATQAPKQPAEKSKERIWDLTGFVTLGTAFNYQHAAPSPGQADFRGLSRLRLTWQPELSVALPKQWRLFASGRGFFDAAYAINDRDQYISDFLKNYERETELREAFVAGKVTSKVDFKFGRQIVVWGKSDSIRVVDVLNPLDFREPGLVDIEGLRLPVTMARADYYFGDWSVTAIAIPEIRFNKMPVYGSDFFPGNKNIPEDKPTSHLTNTEYAFAVSGIFSGWDISFHAADYFDDNSYFVKGAQGPQLQKHARLQMAGAAANVAMGSWLLKNEVAFVHGLQFANVTDRDFSRVDFMAGVDYSGITNHTLSFEAVVRRLLSYDKLLAQGPDSQDEFSNQYALRYTGSFLREKLQVTLLASLFGSDDIGGFYRASADYKLRDAVTVSGGAVVYQSGGNAFINAIARNDRVFAELRFDY